MKAKSIALILAAVLIIAVTPFGSLSTVAKDVLAEAMASPPSSWQARPLAAPVGTAFTYQGQLMDGSDPADGLYDFRFILYNSEVGGSQVGSIVYKDSTLVSKGLFAVELDFGASAFAGQARWLEIGVGPGGSGTYTALSGRQEITPAPYSLHALSADTLDSEHGAYYRDASNMNAGVLATDRFSAYSDLGAEGYLADAAGDLARNNGTLQSTLNADLLDGVEGSYYERSYVEGTVAAGGTQIIEIPHWYPFTLQLGSGWPDVGGVAFVTGMENDYQVGVTYIAYNGNGTSSTGGAECGEASSTVLLQFGNGSYVYQLKCPGESAGAHNLVLVATGSSVELRYKLIY
jgi:hypothetical protein